MSAALITPVASVCTYAAQEAPHALTLVREFFWVDTHWVVVACSTTHRLLLYRFDAMTQQLSFTQSTPSCRDAITDICVSGSFIFFTSEDGSLRAWDPHSDSFQQLSDKRMRGALFSVDVQEDKLACGGTDTFYLWNWRANSLVAVCDDVHVDAVTQVRFSPDGKALYTGGDDGLVNVFLLEGFRKGIDMGDLLDNTLPTEQPVCRMGFFGRNNEYLYVVSSVATVTLWKVEECELIGQFTGLRDDLSTVVAEKLGLVLQDLYRDVTDEEVLVKAEVLAEGLEAQETGDMEEEMAMDGADGVDDATQQVVPVLTQTGPTALYSYRSVDTTILASDEAGHVNGTMLAVARAGGPTLGVSLSHPAAFRVATTINCHYCKDTDQLTLVCGSFYGMCLFVTLTSTQMTPVLLVKPGVAHQQVIRDSAWRGGDAPLFTVAEDGHLAAYTIQEQRRKKHSNRPSRAGKKEAVAMILP